MLSYQAIDAAQLGHAERGAQRLRRSGSRAMTTLRKLPSTRPNTTTIVRVISELILREHVPSDVGVQLAKDRQVLAHFRHVPGGPIRSHEADAWLGLERVLRSRTMQLGERL